MAHRRTLTDLRAAVRAPLDEASATFWTNANLNRYLNRAKNRVWASAKQLKADYFDIQRASTDGTITALEHSYACSSFAIAAGTRNYTLPPDLVELRLIECITSNYEDTRFIFRPLTHPDMRRLRELTTNVPPDAFAWSIIGERTLTIAPLSDTALDLRITYVPWINDLGGAHAVTSITRSGTTATLTTGFEHGLETGDSVTVAGATQTDYNITATITVTTTTAFTYTVANSPATPATGTITYTTDADRLEMPFLLADAVEAYATSAAFKQDRNYDAAGAWEATGKELVIEATSSHARQSQDAEFVVGYFEE